MRFLIYLVATTLFTLLFTCQSAFAVREVKSASYPDISADGQTVYFSCWGDIWSAPRDGSMPARRLTANEAYDGRPVLSPDGKLLAFLSDRYGNYDIFVMPAAGGEATRLTWHSGTDYLYDWRPDGKAILCYLARQDLWGQCLYEVGLDGSAPKRISGPDHDAHVYGSYLGDDKHLIYARDPGDWAEKRYRGSGAYDLWSFNALTGEHKQLTDFDGPDLWPQPTPDGEFVFFVSDRDGTKNIWKLDMHTGQQTQITRFHEDGPLWPRISSDGDELIFEVFGELWTVSTRSGQPKRVPITFTDDTREVMAQERDFNNNIDEYALSPNGRYIAVSVWGDLFLLKNPDSYKDDEKPDQDLSRTRALVTGPGREQHISWHPDGKKIAYVSDRDGNFDVYTLDLTTLQEQRITNTKEDEAYPDFAPKGDRLAYYSGLREIRVYEFKTGNDFVIFEGMVKGGPWHLGCEWAPDGYWLAVEEQVNDIFTEIKLVNIEDRKPHNISKSPDWTSNPAWSPDGKYLAYTWAYEDGTSDVMLLELADEEETYDTDLLFPEDQPKPEDGDEDKDKAEGKNEVNKDKDNDDKAKDEKKGDEENGDEDEDKDSDDEELEPIEIDFDRIHLRARSISSTAGQATNPHFDPDSSYIIYATDHEGRDSWWSVEIEDSGETRLTDADKSAPEWSPDGKKLYFLDGSQVVYLEMSGYRSNGSGSLNMRSRVDYDQYRIWEQVLGEAWRMIDSTLYDPTIGGVDWDSQLKRYLSRVRESGTPEEFGNIMRQMLGETGKSHMGYSGFGSSPGAAPENTASFGVLYDEAYDGPGWRIAQVLPNGPGTLANSRLYPGDVILAVGDTEITTEVNRERLMCNKAGLPVKLKVRSGETALEAEASKKTQSKGEENGKAENQPAEREVVIKPYSFGYIWDAWYEVWIDGNRQHVYDLSDHRIAYQYIREMNSESLEQFRRELFTETQGKEALIIDLRFNDGGSTAVDTLNLLDHRAAYLRKHRDNDTYYTARQLHYDGLVVVLVNAHCFSNAEIFAHIMKDLGKGVIIGETTPGGVISTYSFPLLLGTMRVPAWGNYRLNGEDMEWDGCVPDVYVHIDPQAAANGQDNQLDAAVEYLLKALDG